MSGSELSGNAAAAQDPGGTGGSESAAADSRTVRLIEALLFSAAEPVRESDLAQRLPDPGQLDPALKILRSLI